MSLSADSNGEQAATIGWGSSEPVAPLVAEHQASEGTCKIEINFAGAPGGACISALQVAPRQMLPPEAL